MGSLGLMSEPSSRRVWGQRPGQPKLGITKNNFTRGYQTHVPGQDIGMQGLRRGIRFHRRRTGILCRERLPE